MRAVNGKEYNFQDLILNKAADELKLDKLLLQCFDADRAACIKATAGMFVSHYFVGFNYIESYTAKHPDFCRVQLDADGFLELCRDISDYVPDFLQLWGRNCAKKYNPGECILYELPLPHEVRADVFYCGSPDLNTMPRYHYLILCRDLNSTMPFFFDVNFGKLADFEQNRKHLQDAADNASLGNVVKRLHPVRNFSGVQSTQKTLNKAQVNKLISEVAFVQKYFERGSDGLEDGWSYTLVQGSIVQGFIFIAFVGLMLRAQLEQLLQPVLAADDLSPELALFLFDNESAVYDSRSRRYVLRGQPAEKQLDVLEALHLPVSILLS
ncbi:MAG: hypothetical protein IAB19_01090 [Proteobacteria bacterium]|uniref:Uncharacterized protein n=1 Tax=Candidatus Avisuccinivibrio stercorigallinarum TaxID=2840704 RepID=A0A9D9D9R0_9GAMM|nr:hypothetical protein [Candidatus Avisuccinivibrio stercorigallinarum]